LPCFIEVRGGIVRVAFGRPAGRRTACLASAPRHADVRKVRVAACTRIFPKCRAPTGPGGVERDPLRGTVTFRIAISSLTSRKWITRPQRAANALVWPSASPIPAASGRYIAALHAHVPKCRHRREPVGVSGTLVDEPVTFRALGAGVSCYWHISSLLSLVADATIHGGAMTRIALCRKLCASTRLRAWPKDSNATLYDFRLPTPRHPNLALGVPLGQEKPPPTIFRRPDRGVRFANRPPVGGSGPPTNDQSEKSGAITPRGTRSGCSAARTTSTVPRSVMR